MAGIWWIFYTFLICCVCTIGLSILFVLKKDVRSIIGVIISFAGILITWFSINVPCPEIFPLDNEIIRSDYQNIQIISDDKLDIYYTLDGTDPKFGKLYTDEIILEESATVAARTKFFIWWSDPKERNYRIEKSVEIIKNDMESAVDRKDEFNEEDGEKLDDTVKKTDDNEESELSNQIIPTETHVPNDAAWTVSLLNWDAEKDYGIDGNRYNGGFKIDISNIFSSMGSNLENKITSRVMIPIGDSYDKRFYGTFVLDQNMYGSSSSATIKILADNEELFSTGEIDGNTTNSFDFDVNCEDADSYIIETTATLRETNFTYGVVNQKDE